MTEKLISLNGVDPKSLFGTLNKNMDQISQAFPKLKIISRGSDLKVMGDEKELLAFEEKLETILQFLHEYNEITEDDLNILLDKIEKGNGEKPDKHNEVLVYGNNGKPIQARTVNQKKLVEDYQMNDLLLAIGPAGTGKTYTS
ncbi:MAG: phosphate starvation-inducible protein PhoH, partial [Bacteroidetes bacterium]